MGSLARGSGRTGTAVAAVAMVVAASGCTGAVSSGHPVAPPVVAAVQRQPADYVNPFVGTGPSPLSRYGPSFDSGDVFPGAVAPYGMLAWSPDTAPTRQPGGYAYPDGLIRGFSLTHFSGRGCVYEQDVPIMPVPRPITASPATGYAAAFAHRDETARPGYYKVRLATGVTVELAATTRTGLGAFTFPATPESSLVIDAAGSVTGATAATVRIDQDGREVTGSVTAPVGCGSGTYTLYFAAVFDRTPRAFGTWTGPALTPGGTGTTGTPATRTRTTGAPATGTRATGAPAASAGTGAYVSFDTGSDRTVSMRTAVSYVSVAGARANLAAEGRGWDLAGTAAATGGAWNRLLGRIQVTGGTAAERQVLYTALYHCFIDPSVFSDVDGRYLGFDGKVHRTPPGRSFYSNIPLWDQYRDNVPLRALLAPRETSDIVRSLIEDARQGGGGLPRWVQAAHNSAGMIGDSPDPYIASAYAWGARDFDTAAALSLMVAGASDPGVTSDGHPVREHLRDWLTRHYVPNNPSLTLEYAIDDASISQFAAALGDTALADRFRTRSGYWANTVDPATRYAEPRSASGAFPAAVDPGLRAPGFTEGNSAQYTLMVPSDPAGLVALLGGQAAAHRRLDDFFTGLDSGPDSPHLWIGNEPGTWTPYLYDALGDSAAEQRTVHAIELATFAATPGGLPGNDDAGATSAWYVLSAIGLFPATPGVARFATVAPLFTGVTVTPETGPGFGVSAPAAGDAGPVLTRLTLDGRPYPSTSITPTALSGRTLGWNPP